MITGIHTLIYTTDAEAARVFIRDVLGFDSVDAGDGWLIFRLPPAELGVHPSDGSTHHRISLMCDEISATVADLTKKGAEFEGPAADRGYGIVAVMKLPGGATIDICEPHHPTAI